MTRRDTEHEVGLDRSVGPRHVDPHGFLSGKTVRRVAGYFRDGRERSVAGDSRREARRHAAGVGVGSIYHYFADRDALLDWVVMHVLRPDLDLPSELPIGRPALSFTEAITPYLDVHLVLPYLHRVAAEPLDGDATEELAGVIGEFCALVVSTDRVQTRHGSDVRLC